MQVFWRGAQMIRLQPAGNEHVAETRAVQDGEHGVSGFVNSLRNAVADLVADLEAMPAQHLKMRRDTAMRVRSISAASIPNELTNS